MVDQQAAIGAVVVELVEHVLDLAAGNPQAEMLAGHRFDHVGFVEDHHVVVGQDAGPLAAERQIGEKQGVIDDQDLGVGDPPPGAVVETVVVGGARPAHAVAVVAGHFVPHLADGAKIEVRKRAVPGLLRPGADRAEIVELLLLGKQSRRAAQGIVQPPQAEVIAAALGQHRGELQRDDAGAGRGCPCGATAPGD